MEEVCFNDYEDVFASYEYISHNSLENKQNGLRSRSSSNISSASEDTKARIIENKEKKRRESIDDHRLSINSDQKKQYESDNELINPAVVFSKYWAKPANIIEYKVNEIGKDWDYKGEYKKYEIFHEIKDRETNKKCIRRYCNFVTLDLKLKNKYPCHLIPCLPEANFFKKYWPDQAFSEERRRGLEIYVNYLSSNEFFRDKEEVVSFLNHQPFNEDLYRKELLFPETKKYRDKILNMVNRAIGVFTGLFAKQEKALLSPNEIKIKEKEIYFKNLLSVYEPLYIQIKELIVKNILKTLLVSKDIHNHYKTFSYQMSSFDDFFNENQDFFEECMQEWKKDADNYLYTNDLTGHPLLSKVEKFIFMLKGLCGIFDRWNRFIAKTQAVEEAFGHAKNTEAKEVVEALESEYTHSESIKKEHAEVILSEIERFHKKYKKISSYISSQLVELFRLIYQ